MEYIAAFHGNKELIEQGVEKDGRKYYKIYYENEI